MNTNDSYQKRIHDLIHNNRIQELYKKMGGSMNDIKELYCKVQQLVYSQYRKRGSGEIRFCFHGATIPYHVEDVFKSLRRNFHSLSSDSIIVSNSNDKITILSVLESKSDTVLSKKIIYNIKDKEDAITISEFLDEERGKYPFTEIKYKNKIYRPVRFHGDVLNHSHHQKELLDEELLVPMMKQGLISEEDRLCYLIYLDIHDLPELWDGENKTGDQYSEQKIAGGSNDEMKFLSQMIDKSKLFNEQEKIFLIELHRVQEGEKKEMVIGAHERVIYMHNAIDMYKDKEYLNAGALLSSDVLKNTFRKVVSKDYKVYFPKLISNNIIQPQLLIELPFTQKYFKMFGSVINEIIKYTDDTFDQHEYYQKKYFNNDKAKEYLDEEQCRVDNRKNIILLHENRKTIQREQANLRSL